jgi:ABC-2 type transport system permease protein
MKYIPVTYRRQLNAKAVSGLLVSLAGTMFLMAIVEAIAKAPLPVFLGATLLMVPGGVILNYFGLLVDLMKPKLLWDNETMAVKQNLNVMVVMFGGMLLAAAVGLVGALLLKTPLTAFIALFLVLSALAVLSVRIVLDMGAKRLEDLNA